LQDTLDLRPAAKPQKDVAARFDPRHRRIAMPRRRRAQYVNPRGDSAKVVGRPSHEPDMLPGANERMRRFRSMICSDTARPNRIRFSMRFSSHKSSTVVRSVTCFSGIVEKNMEDGAGSVRRCRTRREIAWQGAEEVKLVAFGSMLSRCRHVALRLHQRRGLPA
jgi:hypothetical protein